LRKRSLSEERAATKRRRRKSHTRIQAPEARRPPRWLAWTRAHSRLVLGVILAAAVLVRLAYFVELNASPLIWQHRWQASDMYFFDYWAKDIAAGDWLTNKSLHPFAGWNQYTADACFALHPEKLAEYRKTQPQMDPARALWSDWYGGKRYHQDPLYPYLIALTYKVIRPDVRWVFAWQILLGVLATGLIYSLARRHFGNDVALVAGAFAVLCGPLVSYDLLLLRTALMTVAGLAIVSLADVALEKQRWRRWLAVGAATGAAWLLNEPSALVGFAVLAWMVYVCRRAPRTAARNAAAMVCGLLLLLAPLMVRNKALGLPALGVAPTASHAFICTNASDAVIELGFSLSKYAPEIMYASDGKFLPTVWRTLQTHETPWSYLGLLWRKFSAAWHWYETPDNNNFHYYQLHAPILRYLPVTFFVIGPLSLAGLALAARDWRRHATLYLLVLMCLASLVAFLILGRLRIPLLAALIPFAALTCVRAAEWVWQGRVRDSLLLVAGLIVVSFWTMRPLPAYVPLIRPDDYMVPYVTVWDPEEKQAREQRDWRRAAGILRDSLRWEPEEMTDPRLLRYFAGVHQRLAADLRNSGENEAAAAEEQRAALLMDLSQRGYPR
jgi:4-amino-4-deoxy-L-arabinose transferase-like glycosyltransferase